VEFNYLQAKVEKLSSDEVEETDKADKVSPFHPLASASSEDKF
jgi:hypothetical protein